MFDTILVYTFLMFRWNVIKSDTSDVSSVKVSKSNVQADYYQTITIFCVENIHISLATGWHLSSLEYLCAIMFCLVSTQCHLNFVCHSSNHFCGTYSMCVYIYCICQHIWIYWSTCLGLACLDIYIQTITANRIYLYNYSPEKHGPREIRNFLVYHHTNL